jgi:predicted permease
VSLYQRVGDQLAALPGVDSVTVASAMPGGGSYTQPFELASAAPTDARGRPVAMTITVGANYFGTIGVAPREGRGFNTADASGGQPVAIVNQGFVRAHLRGADPIGARLRLFNGPNTPRPDWLTIVGVVPDLTQTDFSHTASDPMLYLPFRQDPHCGMIVLVATHLPPGSLGEGCRRAIQAVDPDLPAHDVAPVAVQFAQSSWPIRVFGGMFAIFAGIALLLASVGLYAVVAHMVSQRAHEIGVRVALGASRGAVARLVFAQGMTPMAIGLALGLAAACGVTRVLAGLLVGVSPTDPLTFILVAAVLLAAGAAGCAAPAGRALGVDPAEALRHE